MPFIVFNDVIYPIRRPVAYYAGNYACWPHPGIIIEADENQHANIRNPLDGFGMADDCANEIILSDVNNTDKNGFIDISGLIGLTGFHASMPSTPLMFLFCHVIMFSLNV